MSDTDSFIDEVNEEVRKDRLYGLLRRYGWIAILLVILLVGGAAFREYRLASARAEAQATGDAVLAALQSDDQVARATELSEIAADGDAGALVALLAAADEAEAGEQGRAQAQLEQIASNADLSVHIRHLAALKLAMLGTDDATAEDRLIALAPLAAPGAPYRLLAEEQIALIEMSQGKIAEAIARLELVEQDVEVTTGLRQRARDVIVALGGSVE